MNIASWASFGRRTASIYARRWRERALAPLIASPPAAFCTIAISSADQEVTDDAPWSPERVRAKRASFLNPYAFEMTEARWRFSQVGSPHPFVTVFCELDALGGRSTGCGDGWTPVEATTRALAEAWERLVMDYAKTSLGQLGEKVTSSNGWAAGPTNEAARTSARHELIERRLFLEAWQSRSHFSKHKPTSPMARWLRGRLAAQGWDLGFHLVHDNLGGALLMAVLRHPRFGAATDIRYLSPGSSWVSEEERLSQSIYRALRFFTYEGPDPEWTLPERAKPIDHGKYYSSPEHCRALDFLRDLDDHRPIDMGDAHLIETMVLFDAGQLPAVAQAWHPTWAPIRWGTSSIGGENPHPHPLA